MATLDANDLFQKMLGAAGAVFKEHWPEVQRYASFELQKTANQLVDIERGVLQGDYSRDVADALLRMQKIASQTVILAMTGMTLLAVEAAINAILGVIRDAVNTAIGFVLI